MMKSSRWAAIALAVAIPTVIVSCADDSTVTAPGLAPVAANGQNLLGGTASAVTNLLVAPLERSTALANDVVWSFTAGPNGAVSSNSQVGLTVAVPKGALSSPTTIKVIALAGAPVAYAFEPHLEFAKQVVLTQNLRGTTAEGAISVPLLYGAHFASDRLELNAEGLVAATETVAATTNLFTKTVSFGVSHFSGWLVASGNRPEDRDRE